MFLVGVGYGDDDVGGNLRCIVIIFFFLVVFFLVVSVFFKLRVVLIDIFNELFIINSVRLDDDGEMYFFICCISVDKVFIVVIIFFWNWCFFCIFVDKVFIDFFVFFWFCFILCRSFIMSFSLFGVVVGNILSGLSITILFVCDVIFFFSFWCWWICCWIRFCLLVDSFLR